METNHPPEELFLAAYARFYDSLKQLYVAKLERAVDKTYASNYFKQILFRENRLLPVHSVFYRSLVSTFAHFQKIGEANFLEQTLAQLDEICAMTSDMVERTFILHTRHYKSLDQLHWLYVEAVEDRNMSVLELIETEQRLLKYRVEKVVLLLALTQATRDLLVEFSDSQEESEQMSFDDSNPIVQYPQKNKLTRSQQVLIAWYMFQILGVKHKKNVSKCADALHTFLGVPYSQITHSELYKKLLNPLTFSSEKATLQNLQVVKAFFEKIGLRGAVNLVEMDMKKLKKILE